MICVTKLDGEKIALNSDLIVQIEDTPDTVIMLVTGQAFRVRETLEEVCAKVGEFRRSTNSRPSVPIGIRECAS